MAQYPADFDNFSTVSPAATDKLNSPDHASLHREIHDVLNELEAKVGKTSDSTASSHDYKLSGVTGTDKAASKTGTETLTNKTLTTPTIASILNGGTLTLPAAATDTLVGRATTDTLTNKSVNLGSNTVTGTTAQFNTALSDNDFATLAGTETLTNKTLSTGSVIDSGVTVTEVLKKVYPVGCLYFSTNSTNPNTSLGFGTWSAFGAGQVPVGFDAGQTEFDLDEETGGAKTHTLTTAEIPAHTHDYTAPGATNESSGATANSVFKNSTTVATSSTGGGGAHNNLQPYIVVRMWKRTA